MKQSMLKVKKSSVHGTGVFAKQRIRKGTRVIEYLGDRVSHAEADRRYEDKGIEDNHTFLFIVDGRTVIDAGVGGNEARFINHSCDPNCETVTIDRRIFVEAIRTIEPGAELNYDYQIKRDKGDPKNIDEVFACRCGAKNCRGTMLEARKPAARRKSGKKAGKKAVKTASKLAKKSEKKPVKKSAKSGKAAKKKNRGKRQK